jgi:hypothetical protein
MYFYGRRYLWDFEYSNKNDRAIIDAIGKQFPEIRGARVEEVKAEFKTWRKANQIHKWFVDNIQDGVDECQESRVPVGKLYKLRDLCAEVVADPSRAQDLLPSQSGFFFGGTEYDEWYHRDVKETLDWLNDLLLKDTLDTLKDWDFYYRSSW